MVKEDEYLLTNQEILGGLRSAIARGESLKDAMMTFYQAGYDKFEIEEAAKAYLEIQNPSTPQVEQPKQQKIVPKKEEKKEDLSNKKFIRENSNPIAIKELEKPKAPQIVSNYEAPLQGNPPKGTAITIVLIIVLLLLMGILASVFLFKAELIEFFNGMFA